MPIASNVKPICEICRMQILVVSATEMEIAQYISGKPGHDYLITGVGIAACMYRLTNFLQKSRFDLVIQAGIAGTFNDTLPLESSVLVKNDLFAEAGAFENNTILSLHDLGLLDDNEFPYLNGWLVNDHKYIRSTHLKTVNAITVGMVSDNHLPLNKLFAEKYGAEIETMEGAAFHYVCLQQKIPFIQLRSISNVVGERNKSGWKLKEAIDSLNNSLVKLLTEVEAI